MDAPRSEGSAAEGRAAVLAIDAGNSKTDVALLGADGQVLAVARGRGFIPHLVGATVAVAGLVPLVDEVVRVAGLVTRPGEHVVQHVSACLANADFPAEQDLLKEAIDAHGWGASSGVLNDTFALLRAGLTGSSGIAVICGAGINCTGARADGRTARFAAVGRISGDWGGGEFLWQAAMWGAARAEDGRGDETRLSTVLPGHFGLDSMHALIEAIHLGVIAEHRGLELTPLLFEVAESGDEVAAGIVRRQAREIVSLAVAAMRRLDLLDEPVEVLLGGGVLTAGHPLLLTSIDEQLAVKAPAAMTRVVTAPPVVGAALLGLDHIGASPGAESRLRSAFETRGYRPVDHRHRS